MDEAARWLLMPALCHPCPEAAFERRCLTACMHAHTFHAPCILRMTLDSQTVSTVNRQRPCLPHPQFRSVVFTFQLQAPSPNCITGQF